MATSLAVPFTDIPAADVIPLWPGFVPRRHVTLMVAPGGTGKGLLAVYMAGLVSTGKPWPGEPEGITHPPRNVIIVAPEDDPNEVVAWRLSAAHADNARVFNLTVFPDGSRFTLPGSVPVLRAAMKEIEERTGEPVDLVILDPLMAMLSKGASIATNAHAREITDPLEKVAQDTDSAIVLTHHTVKSGKVAGARGLTDAVRLVLRIDKPDTRTALTSRVRELHIEKANNDSDTRSLRYVILGDGSDVSLGFPPAGPGSDGEARGYTIRHLSGSEPEQHDVRLIHTVAENGQQPGTPQVEGTFTLAADAQGAAEQIIGYPLPWKRGSMAGMTQAAGTKGGTVHTFTVMDLTAAAGRTPA